MPELFSRLLEIWKDMIVLPYVVCEMNNDWMIIFVFKQMKF